MALNCIFASLLSLFIVVKGLAGFMNMDGSMEQQNGNIVIRLGEDYITGQKLILFREFINEMEKFHLNDVPIRQKTEYARLTGIMNKISLHSINLDNAEFKILFDSNKSHQETIAIKLSNVQMTLSFDHWLELETAKTDEEWGVGFFEVKGLEFELEI